MKIDNAIFEIDNAPCGLPVNPLFGWTWRVGGEADAPDCKSVRPIQLFQSKINEQTPSDHVDKNPGHITNERKTLTTPSAWLPVAIALGFVVWARILGVV